MIKKLQELTTQLHQNKARKYEITHEGLKQFGLLKPRAQELLLKLLTFIKYGVDVNTFVITATYVELGFTDASNFYKYRMQLIERNFIVYSDKKYIINPYMINYYSRRQKDYLYKLFGLKKEIQINWGDK